MAIVYLNGEFIAAEQAKISVFDRGFLFADSVYELIPVIDGQGLQMEEHLQRLQRSLSELDIRAEANWQWICTELAARNGGGNQSIYLQVSRGADSRRRADWPVDIRPTIFACAQPISRPLALPPEQTQGIKLVVQEDLRWGRCDIKSTMLLPNVMARQAAKRAQAEEALLVKQGRVIEGASSSIFMVQYGQLITPPLDQERLPGTTRALVLRLAAQANINLQEREFTLAELLQAEEVWISSSSRGVLPVVQIDQHVIADGQPGSLWRQLAALYQAWAMQE
ncbi:aminotransferase class IV [Balneatrix alpica]|uniref:branched-chain-amino-acid transaminase n=1 Tax=Balneatrix alpica TaxID=75684 RepID=A0ABV5ZCY1_9GAMM|nr:aminotransferase class IV [Balneatrix alpica]